MQSGGSYVARQLRRIAGRCVLTACAVGLFPCFAQAADELHGCMADPALQQLDFWIGDWDVWVAGERVGHDRVAKLLGGCAVLETWTASEGSVGDGLFYYSAGERLWKQVWVTDRALLPGGLKEKHLVARFADGGVRFQGEVALPQGDRILDRTTLRPIANGRVSQQIEISRDGGEHWSATFDAEYRPSSVTSGQVSPSSRRRQAD